jgi:hypothetical protein
VCLATAGSSRTGERSASRMSIGSGSRGSRDERLDVLFEQHQKFQNGAEPSRPSPLGYDLPALLLRLPVKAVSQSQALPPHPPSLAAGTVIVGPVGKFAPKIFGRQKEADRRISRSGYCSCCLLLARHRCDPPMCGKEAKR